MGGRTNQVTYKCFGWNLSPSTYRWKDEPSHSRVPWSKFKSSYLWVERMNQAINKCLVTKFKSFYLRVEGRTKSLTSDSVQNLSPSTHEWKDKPSHLRVPWSKIKILLPMGGRMNQVTHECLGRNLIPSTYVWKDEPSHQQVPWSKFKSSYLRVGGRTKPLTSSLVQNLSPSTYGWKDEPSHLRVPWSKIEVLLPTDGKTN